MPQGQGVWVDSPESSEVKEISMSMPRTQGAEATEAGGEMGLEGISLQERLFREAWRGWEESLRMARRHRRLGEVAAKIRSSSELKIIVQKLAKDEQARLKVWKRKGWTWEHLDWMNEADPECVDKQDS